MTCISTEVVIITIRDEVLIDMSGMPTFAAGINMWSNMEIAKVPVAVNDSELLFEVIDAVESLAVVWAGAVTDGGSSVGVEVNVMTASEYAPAPLEDMFLPCGLPLICSRTTVSDRPRALHARKPSCHV